MINKKIFKKIKGAPKDPGVYIWKDKVGQVLYIGKAVNLRSRLLYYTKPEKELIAKTAKFLKLAENLSFIVVRNELEAILLEMNLIRTLKPKYNVVSKDDKRPLFIQFTKDKFPRIKTSRTENLVDGDFVGPFASAYQLKQIMRKLRQIFPYCSCNNKVKTCLYYDLGLCLGIGKDGQNLVKNSKEFDFEIRKIQYRKNIKNLKLFLSGKIDKVVKILEKEMKEFSDTQEYEKANLIKGQIFAIRQLLENKTSIRQYLTSDHIRDHLIKSQNKKLANLIGLTKIERIEGYDIANTEGTMATASMVVFENGFSNTSKYRKFKMKFSKGPDDPLMIYETLLRRFNHRDWQLPDLILIDGGKTQVKAAYKALSDHNLKIVIVGLAKKFERLVFWDGKEFEIKVLPSDNLALTLLRAVRDEAHRFTTSYHKSLREKNMLGKI